MSNKNMNMGNYDIFRSSSDSKLKAYKQAGVAIYVHKAYRDSVNNIIDLLISYRGKGILRLWF